MHDATQAKDFAELNKIKLSILVQIYTGKKCSMVFYSVNQSWSAIKCHLISDQNTTQTAKLPSAAFNNKRLKM